MPFVLDGRNIAPDAPFTHDGIQYPANWIRLSTEEEKAAIGMVCEPDPEPYDQRFYWGRQDDGTLIPKGHAELVKHWVGQTKTTAGSLLASSDWYITRMAETGTAAPQEVLDRRGEIRSYSNTKEQAILATTSTEELAAYITSAEYSRWEPELPAEEEPSA